MIYTSFQSIFSEKQLDSELDQIEPKSSKQIKRIVLHYMEQRRSINNSLKKDKKQTVSLKDHSPPILEPSTWKINVHSAFYQQIKDKQEKQQLQQLQQQLQQQNNTQNDQRELSSKSDNTKSDDDSFINNQNSQNNDEVEEESNDDTYDEYSNTDDDDQNEHKSFNHNNNNNNNNNHNKNNINRNSKSEAWQFKANIHHIIQGHQPSTRILTIESKKNANLVLTGGSEGNIRMWRVEYSKLRDLTQYTQHLGPIKNISFLKYTDQIASCCGEIHVWDSAKCETIRKFIPHSYSSSSSSSSSSSTLSSKSKDLKLSSRQHSRSHAHHSNNIDSSLLATKNIKDRDRIHSTFDHLSSSTDKYTCMTPFNYCCLLAGNQKGRIEFLDINTRSCSYDWEILPHSSIYHHNSSSHHHHHSTLSSSQNHHSHHHKDINGTSSSSIPSSSSSSQRRVTAIAVRNNQREVAVGLSDGQIVILDLRNGFIVESFHEFNYEITKLYWSNDNILIALCRDQGLYVFNCNQISRLYLQSCQKFNKYPKDNLFKLDNYKSILSSSSSKKSKKKQLVTIGNSLNNHNNDHSLSTNNVNDDDRLSTMDKNKLHQQISKKLIEIGDASNDLNDDKTNKNLSTTSNIGEFEIIKKNKYKNKNKNSHNKNRSDKLLFDGDEYFDTVTLPKDHNLRKKDVAIRTLLLNPNFNGNIDDYSRYTEHIRAYHSYINNNNSMASNGMEQENNDHNKSGNSNNNNDNDDYDDNNNVELNVSEYDQINNCNNLLPFTPIISKPFLFNSTPEIIARYNPSKFDQKSLKTIKTNLSQYKITDFGLYKSNIICSIGKGIGYAKLKTPIQILKEPTIFTQQNIANDDLNINNDFATKYNSKMITRSFPSLKTKSSLSSLSILENMHLVIIGTNNGKIFTCG